MKRYKNLISLHAVLIIVVMASCKKVLDKPPLTSITSVNYFQNGDDAESAIIGCYDGLQGDNYYGSSLNIMGELPSDNVGTANTDAIGLDKIQWNSTTAQPNRVYQSAYIDINRTNSVLKYVPNITKNILSARKSQILGEAYFLRALNYFNLVKSYGGVPLHIAPTENATEANITRSSPDQIYAQIESDLTAAESVLPTTFGGQAIDRTRATKGAADALLAKVYLYERKWALAVTAAGKVISNSNYGTISTPFNSLFPFKNKQESILEIQNAGNADGQFTLPDLLLPSPPASYSFPKFHIPTLEFINYIDTLNDIRFKRVGPVQGGISFGSLIYGGPGNGNDNGWFIYKWRSTNFFASQDNYPVLLLDDIYLVYAEASNEQNGPTQDALDKVNAIRTRAGLPVLALAAVATKSAFRNVVDRERRLELAFLGERWYDLVRYAKQTATDPSAVHQIDALTIINQKRGTPDVNYLLFPIPLAELNSNPLVKQNPGF